MATRCLNNVSHLSSQDKELLKMPSQEALARDDAHGVKRPHVCTDTVMTGVKGSLVRLAWKKNQGL